MGATVGVQGERWQKCARPGGQRSELLGIRPWGADAVSGRRCGARVYLPIQRHSALLPLLLRVCQVDLSGLLSTELVFGVSVYTAGPADPENQDAQWATHGGDPEPRAEAGWEACLPRSVGL